MAKAVEARPLNIEVALTDATQHPVGEALSGPGLDYPAELGALAVECVRLDKFYNVEPIIKSAEADFLASYELNDPEVARDVRERSMRWLDWLSRDTDLMLRPWTYLKLAQVAASHGDAETVRQIVREPKRLWLDKYAPIAVSDPAFGRLDQLEINSIGDKILSIAHLMAVAPDDRAEQVQAAVMLTFKEVVAEFASRDLTDRSFSVTQTVNELLAVGTPEALAQADVLIGAMPMTAIRLDVLVGLAEKYQRFVAAAAETVAWHQEKVALAESHLAQYMMPHGTGRDIVDYPLTVRGAREDIEASQPIAAIIVDQIPSGSDTSAIETSLAHATGSRRQPDGNVHGSILKSVRTLTSNPRFEFSEPQFGFSSVVYNQGRDRTNHDFVTVVDANLPEGRIVFDLSSELFVGGIVHEETRFLCRILQKEKIRRLAAV